MEKTDILNVLHRMKNFMCLSMTGNFKAALPMVVTKR